MSRLDSATIAAYSSGLGALNSPFVVAGYRRGSGERASPSLEGAIGYLDWRLHGQISGLIKRGMLEPGALGLIVSGHLLGGGSLLVVHEDNSGDKLAERVVASLKKLQATKVALVTESLSREFRAPLEKRLHKAQLDYQLFSPGVADERS